MAYKTRHSWRIHLLRLLDWLEEADGRGEWYGKQRRRVLKFLKFKREQQERGGSRSQRALNKTEVAQLLDVWAGDERPVAIRNTALLRLMVYTGMRRAEVVPLRWEDIILEDQTVRVRSGKGDKERVAANADVTDGTKRTLLALREAQGDCYAHVFPSMTVERDPAFAEDKPMHVGVIANTLKIAVERSGIGHISAHYLRRSHISLALESGATAADLAVVRSANARPHWRSSHCSRGHAPISHCDRRYQRG